MRFAPTVKGRLREDPVFGDIGMAITKAHVVDRQIVQDATGIDRLGRHQNVLDFRSIGTAVHAQRAANGARNTAEEFQTGTTGPQRRLRGVGVQHRGADPNLIVAEINLGEFFTQPHHHAGNSTITHQQI